MARNAKQDWKNEHSYTTRSRMLRDKVAQLFWDSPHFGG